MQDFWGFILVLICFAIIGCSAVPVNNVDDTSINERAFFGPQQSVFNKIERYHPFNLIAPQKNYDPDNFNVDLMSNYGTHQKRQTQREVRFRQCYFNPISCFRRRR